VNLGGSGRGLAALFSQPDCVQNGFPSCRLHNWSIRVGGAGEWAQAPKSAAGPYPFAPLAAYDTRPGVTWPEACSPGGTAEHPQLAAATTITATAAAIILNVMNHPPTSYLCVEAGMLGNEEQRQIFVRIYLHDHCVKITTLWQTLKT